MNEKVVEVLMDSQKVGRLALNSNGQAMFEYDSDWIRSVGNCDDHVKNFAFIHRNGIWQLSPAYDILPCEGLGGFHSLSVNGNYKNPGKEDAVQLAVKFGLRKDEAEEVFEEIVKHMK